MKLRELGQFSPEARDLGVDLIYVYRHLLGEQKRQSQPLLGGAQWQDKGQLVHMEIIFVIFIYLFYGECGQALGEVAQSGCVVPTITA